MLAGFLVLAGSTADRFGRKRVFLTGLTVFGLGSLLCSVAPGIGRLIAARAVEAVDGTMLNPVALAIVVTTFPAPADRARAIGVFGSMSVLALALGPILGDSLGWRPSSGATCRSSLSRSPPPSRSCPSPARLGRG